MKILTTLILSLLLTMGVAYQAPGEDISLGEASFGAASDQIPTDGYWPMPPSVLKTYEGIGVKAGFSKTVQCRKSESAAGVNAVRVCILVGGGGPDTPVTPPEDWWLAQDTQGNLRVLKVVRGETTVFEASASTTPPVLLPAKLTAGQSWEIFGKTNSVVDMNASFAGSDNLLKVRIETADSTVTCNYYRAGAGPVATECKDDPAPGGSGWKLKQP